MATQSSITPEEMAMLIESLDSERQTEVVQALICVTPDDGKARVIAMLEQWGAMDTRMPHKYQRETLGEWIARSERYRRRAAMVRLVEYAALVAAVIAACVWAAVK